MRSSTMLPSPEQTGITVDLDDSVTTARGAARGRAGDRRRHHQSVRRGMRAIKCEAMSDPELARLVDERFQAPRRAALLSLLRRGVERGEVRPEAATQLVADVIPACCRTG